MRAAEVSIANVFSAEELGEMARESGFVKRRSPVTGMRFPVTFTTGLLNTPDGTLAQLAAFLGGTCGAGVSAQAVDQRINFGVKLISPDGTDLDLRRLLKSKPDPFDLPVTVGSRTCRLVGRRLPDDVVASRIR